MDRQNIEIEYHPVEDQSRDLPRLIAELKRRKVALIVGNTPAAHAARTAGTTVPFVFASGKRPCPRWHRVQPQPAGGGNVTGVVFFKRRAGAKRVELLRQLVPGATTIAMLGEPDF